MKDIGFYIVENKKLNALSKSFPMLNYHITQTRVNVNCNCDKYETFRPDMSLIEDTGTIRIAHITLMIMKEIDREIALEKTVDFVIENQELRELQYLVVNSILSFLMNTHTALRLIDKLFSNINYKHRFIYLDYMISYCYGDSIPQFITAYNSILFKHGFSNIFYRCLDCDYQLFDFYSEITEPLDMKDIYRNPLPTFLISHVLYDFMLFSATDSVITYLTPIYILYEYQNLTDVCGPSEELYNTLITKLSNFIGYFDENELYKKYASKINLSNCFIKFDNSQPIQRKKTNVIILLLIKEITKYYCKNAGVDIKDLRKISTQRKNMLFPAGEKEEHAMNHLFSEPIPLEPPFIIPFVPKKDNEDNENNHDSDDFGFGFDLFDEYSIDDDEVTITSVPITSVQNYALMYSDADTYR